MAQDRSPPPLNLPPFTLKGVERSLHPHYCSHPRQWSLSRYCSETFWLYMCMSRCGSIVGNHVSHSADNTQLSPLLFFFFQTEGWTRTLWFCFHCHLRTAAVGTNTDLQCLVSSLSSIRWIPECSKIYISSTHLQVGCPSSTTRNNIFISFATDTFLCVGFISLNFRCLMQLQ